jgi:hypothetical protein
VVGFEVAWRENLGMIFGRAKTISRKAGGGKHDVTLDFGVARYIKAAYGH